MVEKSMNQRPEDPPRRQAEDAPSPKRREPAERRADERIKHDPDHKPLPAGPADPPDRP